MKKFRRLTGLTVVLYLVLALTGAGLLHRTRTDASNEYRVEINRLQNELFVDGFFASPDLSECTYVKEVVFLPIEAQEDAAQMAAFYRSRSAVSSQIVPIYQQDELVGYARFDYEVRVSFTGIMIAMQVALALMEIVMLGVLFHVGRQIIAPFQKLIAMPEQMAKGQLQQEVMENRNRYFGKFIWGIGILQDQLEAARRKALRLEKEKKLMTLSISHDIKTPLNNIKLYARAMEEHLYDAQEKQLEAAHRIGERAADIERFVEELVQNAQADILDTEVEMGEFYLKDLMRQVEQTYRERCERAHTSFLVGAFQNRLVKGDFYKTLEVIGNLIENAMKYGDGRVIEFAFYEEDYCQLIRIHNTGEPVAEQEFNHIFDSFYRGSNAQGKEGNGLGLSICSRIMHKMDGEIYAKRCEDGMDFVLVLK